MAAWLYKRGSQDLPYNIQKNTSGSAKTNNFFLLGCSEADLD
jgi:hypothetical protein